MGVRHSLNAIGRFLHYCLHKIRHSAGFRKNKGYNNVKTKTLKPQATIANPAPVVFKECEESVSLLVGGELV